VAKLNKQLTFEDIRAGVHAEQILAKFNIPVNDYNKCICPFHADNDPSMIVHETWVYCFGCEWTGDVFSLTKELLSSEKEASIEQTFAWFRENWTTLPERTNRVYKKTKYEGPVNRAFVDYWHSLLRDDQRSTLREERLFTDETIDRYRIGYRPDYHAIVFPFWRGEPGSSPIDIVQFRRLDPDAKPKYVGMSGHNRSALMNAHLLTTEHPYLVIMFGTPDAILAAQDGVLAVGLNGDSIGSEDLPRIKELLSAQKLVFVLPDNTQSEFKPAAKVAHNLNAELIFYPKDLPDGTDYITYRYTHSVRDFLTEVVPLLPYESSGQDLVEDVYSLLEVRDPYQLVEYHLSLRSKGLVAIDVARQLANIGCPRNFPRQDWHQLEVRLRSVRTVEQLFGTLEYWQERNSALRGTW